MDFFFPAGHEYRAWVSEKTMSGQAAAQWPVWVGVIETRSSVAPDDCFSPIRRWG